MKKKTILVSIDRVEKNIAIAESDDGNQFEVAVKSFKDKPKEGMIYRVPLDPSGDPVWAKATTDPIEEAKRKADLSARMANLRKRDTGGDIDL